MSARPRVLVFAPAPEFEATNPTRSDFSSCTCTGLRCKHLAVSTTGVCPVDIGSEGPWQPTGRVSASLTGQRLQSINRVGTRKGQRTSGTSDEESAACSSWVGSGVEGNPQRTAGVPFVPSQCLSRNEFERRRAPDSGAFFGVVLITGDCGDKRPGRRGSIHARRS